MEDEEVVYQWSITNKQKMDRDFLLGKYGDNSSRGIIYLYPLILLPIFALFLNKGFISSLLTILVILIIFYLANKSKTTSSKYNDEIAETYKIFDNGIKIVNGDKTSELSWKDINKIELHSQMAEYKLFKLFGCGDAIIIWKKECPFLDDLILGASDNKEEISNYLKEKVNNTLE